MLHQTKLPKTVSTAQLAALFGVSAKTVSSWAKLDVAVRVKYGRFDLARSVRAVVKHHRRSRAETTVAAAVGSQRERLLRAQADRAEMQLRQESGELCRVSEVRDVTLRTFYVLRSGVLAAKARIGNRLPHMSRTDLVEIDDELRTALTEIGQNKYNVDEAWTIGPAELAEKIGLTVEAVARLAKAGILPQPDSEGRVSLWGSVRALVALAARKKGVEQ
jgi:phage terminase Nu1 subunit (DNA packaging protein)